MIVFFSKFEDFVFFILHFWVASLQQVGIGTQGRKLERLDSCACVRVHGWTGVNNSLYFCVWDGSWGTADPDNEYSSLPVKGACVFGVSF